MNYENLSPEQQEKAKACESSEELAALAEKLGHELSEEELDAIAGGGGPDHPDGHGPWCVRQGCSDYTPGCTIVGPSV